MQALRDRRAVDVLTPLLTADGVDRHVLRATSAALGKIGDKASIARMFALADNTTPDANAVIEGLGEARQPLVAEYLALRHEGAPDRARVDYGSVG